MTVILGALRMGMGDRIDERTAAMLKPGGWAVMPKDEHHYAMAAAPTVVQVHMTGPFAITYVNTADDPRTSAEK